MALKQTQELKLVQKLSPLQIQTIKLIEMPAQDLEQYIRKELEENPVLEEESTSKDSVSLSEYKEDDSIPRYKLYVNNQGRDETPQRDSFSVKESFTQSLLEQLGYQRLDEHQKAVAAFIICSLDERGYLVRDIESLVDDMSFRANIETDADEILHLLSIIQTFEPTGVGARDLRECLLLQIDTLSPGPARENARRILTDFYPDFTAKHFDRIRSRMGLSQDDLKAAIAKICKLNPSPGGQIDDTYNDRAQQVVPDFLLEYSGDDFELTMPRFNIPDLRVSRKYEAIMERGSEPDASRSDKEAASFARKKLESAKWFVEAVKQRHNTLMTTMRAILDYQHDYFMDGDEASLRPMVLKDIAEITGFDISTISRVVNSKYIETPFGIYSLKYFFSEGMENADGEEVSTRELKKVLRELVDAENKSKPLTDDELVEMMTERGYKVARRTIAKYRDQLKIPKARLRKELV